MKKEKEELENRIEKLENNQLFLYHQISMHQTSRDMFKSIYYFFCGYLKLNDILLTPNNFSRLKHICDFLEVKDKNKIEQLIKRGIKNIPEDLKPTMAKYFKFHFFLNKVSNKIVHRNFNEEEQKKLKEKKEENLLPLIPGFEFKDCFETLEFFAENGVKNVQLQEAMKMVYESKYINDDKLGSIRDLKKEVILQDKGCIKFLISKKEIEEIKKYFTNIKIGEKTFIESCNDKLWDQAEDKEGIQTKDKKEAQEKIEMKEKNKEEIKKDDRNEIKEKEKNDEIKGTDNDESNESNKGINKNKKQKDNYEDNDADKEKNEKENAKENK